MPDGFRVASAWVEVKPDTEGFREKLQAALDEATAGADGRARIDLDTAAFDAKLDDARARLDEFGGSRAEPSIHLNDEELGAKADEAKAKLDELDARSARPDVGLGTGDIDARVEEVRARLDELDARQASPRIGLDTADFDAKMAAAQARLDRFKTESASAHLKASGGESGGGGEGGLLGMLPGGGMTALLGAGAGLLPGVGGAGMGLGLLGGAGVLGLGGIGEAVSAAHQATQNIGMTSQQKAAMQFGNQVAVQQAQNQVGQAHMQAAQDAITSAQNIESAQMNLASTERNAAEQQVQALQSVKQAQQGVEEANYGLSEAQYNLTQAWETAREQIRQLDDQLADSKLNVEQAQLAIKQAVYQQRLVNQNAYSTDIQRQEAALSVAQAQQQLKDAQDQLTASQYKANLANKQGVEGSQTVIQAKQGVIAAQYQQTNAQAQYADAQRQLTLTELNSQAQIKQAQMQLSAAREQASFQAKMDARSEAIAAQNVANTIKEQKLQWAATMSTENQAALVFQRDMGRLTPAARGVVEQILGMRKAFHSMQQVAENAIAPGLSVLLKGLSTAMPSLSSGIGKVAGVLSQAFGNIGKSLQSVGGKKILEGLVNNGVRFAQIVVPALTTFLGTLAKVGAQKGAVDGIANVIGGLAGGLSSLLNGLSPFVGALSSVFSTLGQALAPVGQLLGTVIGSLASALAPVLKALLPGFSALASALGQGLSEALQAIGPMLGPVATAISDIAIAVAPVLPLLGKLIAQVAQDLTPLFQALVPVIKQISTQMAQQLMQSLQSVMQAITPLLPQIVQLAVQFVPLLPLLIKASMFFDNLVLMVVEKVLPMVARLVADIIGLANKWKTAFQAIESAALWLWHNVLDPMWHGIATGADWLYQNAILPLWHGIETAFQGLNTAAQWLWHSVFDPLWHGIESGASIFLGAFRSTWDTLSSIFEHPVSFIVNTVYNDGIVKLWDGVAGAFGAQSLELKPITGFARGGEVKGGTPGRDSVPAMLMPGERVLSVPQVAKLGGQGGIDRLVGSAQPVYKGGVAHAAGGWSWNPISDLQKLGSSMWNGLKGAVLGGLKAAATPVVDGLETMAKGVLGTTGVGGLLDKGVQVTGKDILDFLGGKDASARTSGGGLPGNSSGAVGNLPANWNTIASFLAAHGFSKYAAAGVAGNIMAESGGNPEILEIGGGGGGGLIQWTPYPRSYITGNYQQDLMTQLNAILSWGGGPSLVNQAKSPSNAAAIYQDYYERPADLTASLPLRMASANAVYKAMGWGTFDRGGIASGVGMLPKATPLPERVLSPTQTGLFERLIQVLERGASAGVSAGGRPVQVEQNFYGSMLPNPEQQAGMRRDLAMALSGP